MFGSIEVAFTDGTPDHQGPHLQETRPYAAGGVRDCPYSEIGAGYKILFKNEKRLNRPNITIAVFDGKIPVIESLLDGVFDQLKKAMILALADEGALPMAAECQLPP